MGSISLSEEVLLDSCAFPILCTMPFSLQIFVKWTHEVLSTMIADIQEQEQFRQTDISDEITCVRITATKNQYYYQR